MSIIASVGNANLFEITPEGHITAGGTDITADPITQAALFRKLFCAMYGVRLLEPHDV